MTIALLLIAVAAFTGTARAVVIDEFAPTMQFVCAPTGTLTCPVGGDFSELDTAAGEAVGDTRAMRATRTSTTGSGFADVNISELGILNFQQSGSMTGFATITWDGDTDAAENPSTGSLALDLSGFTGLILKAGSDLGAVAQIILYTGAATSSLSVGIPAGTQGEPNFVALFFPFAAFVGTADISNLSGIQLILDGTATPGTDVGVDFLATAVPEPATISLFGLGLVGVAGMLRRRRAHGSARSADK